MLISFFRNEGDDIDIQELINMHWSDFSTTDKFICEFLVTNKENIGTMSIMEFSKKSLSSKSSVIRFSQKIGFKGYGELRNFIKWERKDNQEKIENNHLERLTKDTKKMVQSISDSNWQNIYKNITISDKVYIISTGVTQQNQALEFERQLILSGINVALIPGNKRSTEFKRMIEKLTETDIVFVLSLSGENIDLEGVLIILKLKKVVLVSVTNYKSNWLSQNCDYNLYAISSQSPNPSDWWLQTTSTFFVLIESFTFGYNDYLHSLKNVVPLQNFEKNKK